MEPIPEVVTYYEGFPEESRLATGRGRLEFDRTKDLLARHLPKPPARILDVGGAAGAYSAWLAEQGYEVHLVDASARLIDEARRRNAALSTPIATISVADARALPQADASVDVVLLMGPLYHLPVATARSAALKESRRVLASPGLLVVAAVSRYASALDGMARNLASDPAFVKMRDRDLKDGQHRNDTDRADYFTTAYFHRPEDLRWELTSAGFADIRVLGVEGPAWMLADFDTRWEDPMQRDDIMAVARSIEAEPTIIGASAHLFATARKPVTTG
jgi:ubiquinone/menaquinone biosynthesis C-methylase UbiE